jgi:hypothetical protein
MYFPAYIGCYHWKFNIEYFNGLKNSFIRNMRNNNGHFIQQIKRKLIRFIQSF